MARYLFCNAFIEDEETYFRSELDSWKIPQSFVEIIPGDKLDFHYMYPVLFISCGEKFDLVINAKKLCRQVSEFYHYMYTEDYNIIEDWFRLPIQSFIFSTLENEPYPLLPFWIQTREIRMMTDQIVMCDECNNWLNKLLTKYTLKEVLLWTDNIQSHLKKENKYIRIAFYSVAWKFIKAKNYF